MTEQARVQAVRDYLRGLNYQGQRELTKADHKSQLCGLHMSMMGSALLSTSDADIESLLDAGRALNTADPTGDTERKQTENRASSASPESEGQG